MNYLAARLMLERRFLYCSNVWISLRIPVIAFRTDVKRFYAPTDISYFTETYQDLSWTFLTIVVLGFGFKLSWRSKYVAA